ncbi:LysR family transcriptional regulator [Achromobacter aloeverae]|uniref:LysR family transcriptional regulator n=1 Tax=Achromobacter aloeverae TaxID=1750518 RepID=A0A4Q1HPF2_9BURK|nr:LysR substrate-binding domain-containing protein [Achromobacter aloeverae]RXN92809.1 LysR family transcriptional regulator [Achromobacter aloeverae]
MTTRASSLDLRMVHQFLTVAHTLSFRKAAEQMHMAQPPLSQAIKRLESLLEARLFERSARGVRLTPAGEVFRDEATRLLRQAERAVDRTRRADRGELGSVHVGFIGPAMFALLPRLIRTFRERFPGVDVTLHEGSSMQVAAMLLDGTVDVGFLVPPTDLDDDIAVDTLVTDVLAVVLPAGHRLGGEAAVRLASLADESFVMFSAQGVPTLSSRVAALCRQAGFEPRIAQEAVQISTVMGLVAGGVGISLLPGAVSTLIPAGVVCRPILADPSLLEVRICVAYRPDGLNEAARQFLGIARDRA